LEKNRVIDKNSTRECTKRKTTTWKAEVTLGRKDQRRHRESETRIGLEGVSFI
jgi:hypothetical protein